MIRVKATAATNIGLLGENAQQTEAAVFSRESTSMQSQAGKSDDDELRDRSTATA